MFISEERKKCYLTKVYNEMKRRGITSAEIPVIIGKTGFMSALGDYPEEQLHYDISSAVDEILLTAARN